MTKPKTTEAMGIEGFKIRIVLRIVLHGALLHLLSRTEPVVHVVDGRVATVDLEPINGTPEGDTLGYICWSEVIAVSWRAGLRRDGGLDRGVRQRAALPAAKQARIADREKGRNRRKLRDMRNGRAGDDEPERGQDSL